MALGYDRPLYAVQLEQRPAEPFDAATARVVLTGIHQVAAAGSVAEPGELAVLADTTRMPDLADQIAGTVPLVLPMSDDRTQFHLAAGDEFGAQVERSGAAIAHVALRWGPDLEPAAKKAQALEVTRLGAWLHETDRALLIEVQLSGDPRPSGAERSDDLLKAVREVREVGIEPDLWALPGPHDRAEAEAVADLVRDAGRDDVGILVRERGAAPATGADDAVLNRLQAAAGVAGHHGFVLGPAIWSDALAQWRGGALDADAAAVMVADRLRQAIAASRVDA